MDIYSFDDILKRIYELEGLALVARRDDSDHKMLVQLMQDKIAEIDSLLHPMQHAENGQEAEPVQNYASETVHFDGQTAIGSDTVTVNASIEEYQIEDDSANTEDENNDSCIEMEGVQTDTGHPNCNYNEENTPLYGQEEEPSEMTSDYVEPTKAHPDNDQEETNYTADDEDCSDDEPTAVTIDELFQRNISRNLKRAFTINDRFRYRRELFGNSDVEMNDAINLVEAMQSYAEAEEYFYDMLNWDKESPEVKDFMTIIRNHFYGK